jgi:hypothetical protein
MGAPRVTAVAPPRRALAAERAAVAAAAAVAWLLLLLAARVAPDPSGLGTHRRLGLPPCGLYEASGIPCPTCGMTTAFAHAVRGEIGAAARAQPLGLAIAAAAALTAALGPALALLGVPVIARFAPTRPRRAAGVVLGAMLLSWAYKVLVTLRVIAF